MLEAKDLRIDNLIQTDNSTDHYKDVEKVDLEILKAISEGSEFYRPIQLTEEWLVKFGFEIRYKSDDFISYDLSCNKMYAFNRNRT